MEEHPEIQDPRISVDTFLSEALEYHAEDQLFQELGHNGEDAVKYVAKEFLDGQSQLFTQRSSKTEYLLEHKGDLLRSPWLRYGIDLELAYRALRRVRLAGERYLELDYRSLSQPLSDKATQYVAEVVATFAFGFEPASMALCRACVEQILKDALVARKVYSRPYLDRNAFSAKWYVDEAKKECLLTPEGKEAAERIVKKGNQTMHKFLHEERVRKQLALDSIKDLITIVSELEASADRREDLS